MRITTERDWTRMDSYYTALCQDVYAQPPDDGHVAFAADAVSKVVRIVQGAKNVLDVGCGQGQCKPFLEALGLEWTGVVIGEDYEVCRDNNLNVYDADMSFLPFDDGSFDLIFARHVLEHSPFPIMTLMEWRRVCRGWLVVIAPAVENWDVRGKNHYSMADHKMLDWYLNRAGWKAIHDRPFVSTDPLFIEHWLRAFAKANTPAPEEPRRPWPVEYRMLCERVRPEAEDA